MTLVESTSPNALLAASLDAARRQAAVHGAELLEESVDSLAELREEIRSIPGLDVLDERLVGSPSVHAYDPFRLVVDVRATGATGHRIATLLRELADINLELFSENVIVAVFGIGERAARTGARLVAGLRLAIERLGEEEEEPQEPFAVPPAWGPMERTPREAFLAAAGGGAFESAEGRIAAESLAAYPPGVPERPSRRAPDPRDARLHRRLDRPRGVGARGERPNAEDDQGGDRVMDTRATSSPSARACAVNLANGITRATSSPSAAGVRGEPCGRLGCGFGVRRPS